LTLFSGSNIFAPARLRAAVARVIGGFAARGLSGERLLIEDFINEFLFCQLLGVLNAHTFGDVL